MGRLISAINRLRWGPAPAAGPSFHQLERLALFQSTPGHFDIVMLGDSLVEPCNWSEFFPDVRIANRGVGGDTTADIQARLDEVIGRKPRQVFLMAGINDLINGTAVATVAANLDRIVKRLQQGGAGVVLHSILFTGAGFRLTLNPRIAELNAALRSSNAAAFFDLNALLAPAGYLDPAATLDEIHLAGDAHARWAAAIGPLLRR